MAIYLGIDSDAAFVSSDGYMLLDADGLLLRAKRKSIKRKIILNNVVYCLNLFAQTPIINKSGLLSSDNYILTDSSGIYLLPSDYIAPVAGGVLMSTDNYILTDSNGIYLTIKESD